MVYDIIGNLYTFPLISLSHIVSINRLTLILKIISQCDVKHIMTFPIKRITSVLKVETDMHHCSSYLTCCHTTDNVCLYLNNCSYSIYNGTCLIQQGNREMCQLVQDVWILRMYRMSEYSDCTGCLNTQIVQDVWILRFYRMSEYLDCTGCLNTQI